MEGNFGDVMVVGGGISGIQAALDMATAGFKVYLVERKEQLGGHGLKMRKTFTGEPVRPFLDETIKRVKSHKNIEVHIGAEPVKVTGFIGNFHTSLDTGAEFDHGTAIIATGADSVSVDEYLYGQNPNVMKWFDLDKKIKEDPDFIRETKCAVAIHCVGSREPERPYCSKICCSHAIASAIDLKELNPEMSIFMLYRDIRTYGRLEELYQKARSMGIIFVRYDLEKSL